MTDFVTNQTQLATLATPDFPEQQQHSGSGIPAGSSSRSSQNAQTSLSGSGADSRRRDYDIMLGIPCQLDAQAMEWTILSQGQVQRVRSIHDADELISQLSIDPPKLLLLDEEIASSHLQAIARQLPVRLEDCVIGLFADRLSCRQLHMAAGYVAGLLSRKTSVQTFMAELDILASGRKVVSENLDPRVKVNKRKRFEVTMVEKIQNLTNRQLEVLIRIAQGMTAKEAATDLHITEKAVESHKYRLMRVLGVRDRIQLCRWAIREGIISA
ncbi:MAG: response regulator transcription factor [Planctomycetaceae bacterium]